jgi:hypothetical protein
LAEYSLAGLSNPLICTNDIYGVIFLLFYPCSSDIKEHLGNIGEVESALEGTLDLRLCGHSKNAMKVLEEIISPELLEKVARFKAIGAAKELIDEQRSRRPIFNATPLRSYKIEN